MYKPKWRVFGRTTALAAILVFGAAAIALASKVLAQQLPPYSTITVRGDDEIYVDAERVATPAVSTFLLGKFVDRGQTIYVRVDQPEKVRPEALKELIRQLKNAGFNKVALVTDVKNPASLKLFRGAVGCSARSRDTCRAMGCWWGPLSEGATETCAEPLPEYATTLLRGQFMLITVLADGAALISSHKTDEAIEKIKLELAVKHLATIATSIPTVFIRAEEAVPFEQVASLIAGLRKVGFKTVEPIAPFKASAQGPEELRMRIRNKLKQCWRVPGGQINTQTVTIRWRLKQDGSLNGLPTVERPRGDAEYRIAAEAAVRAVRQCAPFELPFEEFNTWKEIFWEFTPDFDHDVKKKPFGADRIKEIFDKSSPRP